MGQVFMFSMIFQVTGKYKLHETNENIHLWEIYFPRDPEERYKNESVQRYKNESFQTKFFNIDVISPRDPEVSL